MSQDLHDGNSDPAYPISTLPAKALQAVYHAVTGKVESTEKAIRRNVVISDASVSNLFQKITQELDVQHIVCKPTVTIKITYEDDSKVTYSSWERFDHLRQDETKVTSSLEMKFESVIRVPGTATDQRLVIAVGLDSSLPVLNADRKKPESRLDFGWIAITRNMWRTVEIKIDYVDFIIAKNFMHTVEKWAEGLPATKEDATAKKILASMKYIRDIAPEVGRIGACLFLVFFVVFAESVTLSEAVAAMGVSGLIWGMTEFIRRSAFRRISETAAKNIIPSVILLSEHDTRIYNEIADSAGPTAVRRLVSFVGWGIGTIALNILSSYVFARYFGA